MTMQDLTEITESEIAVRWVELNDWIPAKCLIDDRISDLKAEINEKEDYLRYLKTCMAAGEK